MSTPALIYLALTVFGLGVAIKGHGQPRTGNQSFIATAIVCGLECSLLYWGGFFNQVGR